MVNIYTRVALGCSCLKPLSTLFLLHSGDQFNWWMKLEYSDESH